MTGLLHSGRWKRDCARCGARNCQYPRRMRTRPGVQLIHRVHIKIRMLRMWLSRVVYTPWIVVYTLCCRGRNHRARERPSFLENAGTNSFGVESSGGDGHSGQGGQAWCQLIADFDLELDTARRRSAVSVCFETLSDLGLGGGEEEDLGCNIEKALPCS